MRYGGAVGRFGTLEDVLAIAEVLPADCRWTFLDSAAHGLVLDVSHPGELAKEIDALLPPGEAMLIHEAALRNLARQHDLEPTAVVPAAEHYVTHVPDLDPVNAIRTALQWDLADDLPGAIDLAERYPQTWQRALFEELGWRAGETHTGEAAAAFTETVPVAHQCAFTQGAVRARLLKSVPATREEWLALEAWRTPLPTTCRSAQIEGMALGLLISTLKDDEATKRLLASHPDPVVSAAILEVFIQMKTRRNTSFIQQDSKE